MKQKVQGSKRSRSMAASELSAVFLQLSMMLEAGIATDDAVEILSADAASSSEKALYRQMLASLDEDAPLSAAMAATGRFPAYAVSMVEMGEQTGATESVLRSLSGHYDREDEVAASIRSAVAYPAMMAIMMVVILSIILVKVIPIFSEIYVQLGLELTGAAAVLLRLGTALSNGFLIVLLVLVVLVVAAAVVCKVRGQQLVAGTALSQDIAAGRFASSAGLMLKAGMDLPSAMEQAGQQVQNPVVSTKARQCANAVLEGETLYDALEKADLFSARYRRMLRVGGQMGGLDAMFEEIATRLNADTTRRFDRLIARIEPTMVVVLAVLAGLILLSVMLPLLGILSTL
jgi:type IV pilus assembly protein PilC